MWTESSKGITKFKSELDPAHKVKKKKEWTQLHDIFKEENMNLSMYQVNINEGGKQSKDRGMPRISLAEIFQMAKLEKVQGLNFEEVNMEDKIYQEALTN